MTGSDILTADPGKVQELKRFLAAFDLIAELKTIPNAQSIGQIAEVSAGHLAGADFLASQGKTAEKEIDALLLDAHVDIASNCGGGAVTAISGFATGGTNYRKQSMDLLN